MEPIEPPWQAIKVWIPGDEPDLDWCYRPRNPADPDADWFDPSRKWQAPEIQLDDGRTLVLECTWERGTGVPPVFQIRKTQPKEILAKPPGQLPSPRMNVTAKTSNNVRTTAVSSRFSSLFTAHPALFASSSPLFPASGPATRSFNGLHPQSKFLAVKTVTSALAALSGFGAASLPKNSDAAAIMNLSNMPAHIALSANPIYKNSGALTRNNYVTGNMAYPGAVQIGPDLFLYAGHANSPNTTITQISFGANYNSPSASYNVSLTETYPGYIPGNAGTIDLAVGWTTGFVDGFTPITVGGAGISVGSYGTQVDYGGIGDPSTGDLPSLGDRMAGTAVRVIINSNPYPENLYDFFRFRGSNPTAVLGRNGTSGSGWYNTDGELTHIAIAASANIEDGGLTIGLDLINPEVQAYLQPMIADSWARYNASIPEPTALALLAFGASSLLARRKRQE